MSLIDKTFCWVKTAAKYFFLFSFLSLGACVDTNVSDLRQYFQEVKATPKGTIQPLPKTKIVEAFIFEPEGLRDPFQPVVEGYSDESKGEMSGSGIAPDLLRRKEELEAYHLDTLQMVGTLTSENELWGLIRAADGTIHRVRKGHFLGQNHGQINLVLSNKIEFIEIVADERGAWIEKQESLPLAE